MSGLAATLALKSPMISTLPSAEAAEVASASLTPGVRKGLVGDTKVHLTVCIPFDGRLSQIGIKHRHMTRNMGPPRYLASFYDSWLWSVAANPRNRVRVRPGPGSVVQ